mmetsp:Transcript_94787/g.230297  ORF Transcript_94787/g.230297 Transcript_94787/m.230297 type:complete len:227 (-) Transcript_94787:299-979(-)
MGHRAAAAEPRRARGAGVRPGRGLEGRHDGDSRAREHHAHVLGDRRDGFAGFRSEPLGGARLVAAARGSAKRRHDLHPDGAGYGRRPGGKAYRPRLHRGQRAVRLVGGEGPKLERVQRLQARTREDFVGHDRADHPGYPPARRGRDLRVATDAPAVLTPPPRNVRPRAPRGWTAVRGVTPPGGAPTGGVIPDSEARSMRRQRLPRRRRPRRRRVRRDRRGDARAAR